MLRLKSGHENVIILSLNTSIIYTISLVMIKRILKQNKLLCRYGICKLVLQECVLLLLDCHSCLNLSFFEFEE
jgi:hypothetical protein